MDYPAFQSELGLLLRARSVGTTADVAQDTVLYWNGHKVMGLHLNDKSPDGTDATFEIDEHAFNRLHAQIVAWMQTPRYTTRLDLQQEIGRSSWPDI
jgi:hypothetical protein